MWDIVSNLPPASIIFGGLTLAVLALIYAFYKAVTNHGHDWRQAIDRNSDAFIENAKTNVALVDALRDLKDEIRSRRK
jgi:hypothetical protein